MRAIILLAIFCLGYVAAANNSSLAQPLPGVGPRRHPGPDGLPRGCVEFDGNRSEARNDSLLAFANRRNNASSDFDVAAGNNSNQTFGHPLPRGRRGPHRADHPQRPIANSTLDQDQAQAFDQQANGSSLNSTQREQGGYRSGFRGDGLGRHHPHRLDASSFCDNQMNVTLLANNTNA